MAKKRIKFALDAVIEECDICGQQGDQVYIVDTEQYIRNPKSRMGIQTCVLCGKRVCYDCLPVMDSSGGESFGLCTDCSKDNYFDVILDGRDAVMIVKNKHTGQDAKAIYW